ncbi:MAG: hypothetical protein FWG80_03645 [Alphaproteobacteria bacterium]|nr:hypothetical protein [Alphaproteobacteria bacterium]
MPDFKFYHHDKKDVRKEGVKEKFKEVCARDKNVQLVIPGANMTIPKPGIDMYPPLTSRIYLKDFSFENLKSQLSCYRNVIIEDAHRLTKKDIDSVIKFSSDQFCKVYFIGIEHNENGVPYPVTTYIADEEQSERLPDYGIEKDLSEMVIPATKFPIKQPPQVKKSTDEFDKNMTADDIKKEIEKEMKTKAMLKQQIAEQDNVIKVWKSALRASKKKQRV